MGSEKFTLNAQDLVKLSKNALLVGMAAGLTYFSQNLIKVDFGTAAVFVVPIITVVIDTLIKWSKDNTVQ